MKTIALFLLSVIASFADPAGFKGVPFGTGCASFFQQYRPGGSWAERKLAASIYWSESEQALIGGPPQVSGVMMGKFWSEWLKDSVAGVEANTRFVFAAQSPEDAAKLKSAIDRWTADRALFYMVEATFENRDADKVVAALIEKYGNPTREEDRALFSRISGNVKAYAQVWEMDGAILEFARIAPPKGKPLMIMKSTVVKSLAAKAAAKDL